PWDAVSRRIGAACERWSAHVLRCVRSVPAGADGQPAEEREGQYHANNEQIWNSAGALQDGTFQRSLVTGVQQAAQFGGAGCDQEKHADGDRERPSDNARPGVAPRHDHALAWPDETFDEGKPAP